ncbi:MAG TPA: phosphatidate cytidylyltransferase [Steroidobacteraceae bacterium]
MPETPQPPGTGPSAPREGTVRTRLITAFVLATILLAVLLWFPPAATVGVLTLAMLAGAWEWSAFVRPDSLPARSGFVLLIALLLPLAWRCTATPQHLHLLLLAATAWWLIALVWIALAPTRVNAVSAGLAGVLALVPAWTALMHLRLHAPEGGVWTVFALTLVWMADSGAFFAGRRYGRVKLAPRVSPGKTWEGVIGAMLTAAVMGALGARLFGWGVPAFIVLCLASVAFSIVGDLTESMLKRHVGLKDSGHLFPGHGGVLDRIDSVTAAAPVFLLGLTAGGVMP